jgi:hypothetical protein
MELLEVSVLDGSKLGSVLASVPRAAATLADEPAPVLTGLLLGAAVTGGEGAETGQLSTPAVVDATPAILFSFKQAASSSCRTVWQLVETLGRPTAEDSRGNKLPGKL